MRALSWVWNGLRIVHGSLGAKRAALALIVLLLPFVFHDQVRTYLEARGVRDWPVVDGTMPALVLVGGYLYWRLLRYAVTFEYVARPNLNAHMLDPGARYDTYVALGNRRLRLYHLEVENTSRFKAAHGVAAMLLEYRKAGDSRSVDIRSPLKVANSDAEGLDLNPGARVVFELGGIEVQGADTSVAAEERDGQTFSILPPGSGTIRVLVGARDVTATEQSYTVYIDTTGSMTIKPDLFGAT
jgi:hypothetical protein